MKKNIIVILLVAAFLLMYLPAFNVSHIIRILGIVIMCGCAAATVWEKKS